jgi:hypothetical protein
MLKLLMYKFRTKEFRIEAGTEIRLQPPKCVDEVFKARKRVGGGSYVCNFEFGANLQLVDSFVI